MKYAEVSLDYWKQGDDLNFHLEKYNNPSEALYQHAKQMEEVAEHLRKLGTALEGTKIIIEADSHYISFQGPDEQIEKLCSLNLGVEELSSYYDEE